jgi:Tol biopolymer transport system component
VYEVVSAIGAGGMGEVYLARDTRLHRDAALKILPDVFAFDPDRLARFEREAQVLASLNHPNIAGIYGLEEADGIKALALELVDGPTLADRIAQGPIPLDEAMPIARQIAEALEAAHDAGVIHRDLKPANIKLRPDGTVKVLDFGLAKLGAADASRTSSAAVSYSPTITTPAMTGMGVILGTAAYMAPEQARGKAVDKRADIWAFGCVLYEMLTASRAFDGDDVTVVMASIIKSEPEWKGLPHDTPRTVRTVLQRCLQKDPKQRLRDIGDARLALEGAFDAATAPDTAVPATQPPAAGWRRTMPWVGGAIAGAVLGGAVSWGLLTNRGTGEARSVTRFGITLPAIDRLPSATGTLVAISPDGQTLLYRTLRTGETGFRLYRRTMDRFDATPVGDLNAGESAFFSPDSQWIAFTVGNTLKKMPAAGGPSQTVAELPGRERGASWGSDDTIVSSAGSTLVRVSAAGGTPTIIARSDNGSELWYPQVLPGGRVLYTASDPRPDAAELWVLVTETGERRMLLPGSAGRLLPTGHLVFLRGGSLWAVRFDLDRLMVVGTPVPVIEQVRVEPGGAVQFSVADNGTLVYLPGGVATGRRLVWVDREGREEPIAAPSRSYNYPRISPDGSRVAVDMRDQDQDVWIWEFARRTLTRLTFDSAVDTYPIWTPDGRRVLFFSDREKTLALFWQASDGTGSAERLLTYTGALDQGSVSPDGTRVILRVRGGTGEDLGMLSLQGTPRLEPLLHSKFIERNGEVSPDGRWIAYQSNESGSMEVYVRPFPQVDSGRWQVSDGTGTKPVWAQKGRELLYVSSNATLMSTPILAGSSFSFGNPTPVMDLRDYGLGNAGRDFDVTPDGRRLLLMKDGLQEAGSAQIRVVQNWTEDLERLVPLK